MKLDKAYKAKKYEDKIYATWEKAGAFKPFKKPGAKPFTVMMPPPNATGTLHLGHAVMLALEDIMVRYHRMKGDAALWIPGTDHASIATQNKVERLIAEEGLTRQMLGREKFLKRVDVFVKKSRATIRNQVRKMGSSCDWSREQYTLSPQLSEAVHEIFVRMYKDGLIYRGNRIVNWCPRCSSTLADDEVNYKEEQGKFYYFKYGPIVIGTARPETKFLDKVVVVNPDDDRYTHYIGKKMMVPWIEGEIEATVIGDKSADPSFGTGAMTITPAHDFIDFELAKKHNLEIVSIIDEHGILTSHAGTFAGQNAREARKAIVKKLEEKGLVEKIDENYKHNVARCYRCDTQIEPLVSRQWFIAVDKQFRGGKSLKDMALAAVRKKKTEILPERFEKTYFHWIENLHDWCISRQIWFGHQIPVWYCVGDTKKGGACLPACREPIVQAIPPKKCPHCGSKNITQDPDTLDTWFSAGIWTFSTLGWPKKSADLDFFHPTSVLETGYDILFFWVARMIIMSSYALDEVPFEKVYLHGLVRTREGKKMSKSNPETCIDPLDMIKKYGADALRLSMVIGGAPGNDIRLYEEKIAGFRNFVNKVWNSARFALMQEEGAKKAHRGSIKAKTLADKWILTRTQELITKVTNDIDHFQFSEAGNTIYEFTWNEYCAWYLEIAKGEQQNLPVLNYVLEVILALLHPFVPFVTEALWQHLDKKSALISQQWPVAEKKLTFTQDAEQMNVIIEVITTIRNLRQESRIPASKKIDAILISKKWKGIIDEKKNAIMKLAGLKSVEVKEKNQTEKAEIIRVSSDEDSRENATVVSMRSLTEHTISGVNIQLLGEELFDIDAERTRLTTEHEQLLKYVVGLETKLSNKNFVDRAPAEIVTTEKAKLAQSKERLAKLEHQLKSL